MNSSNENNVINDKYDISDSKVLDELYRDIYELFRDIDEPFRDIESLEPVTSITAENNNDLITSEQPLKKKIILNYT